MVLQTPPSNLAVSSYPSGGGTTTALILANLCGYRYIYAGGMLKAWAQAMGYDPKSNQVNYWEKLYGAPWDHLWESYVKLKFKAEQTAQLAGQKSFYLYDSKIAGAQLLPEDGYLFTRILLTADVATRAQRAGTDTRTEDVAARDKKTGKRWQETYGFDFLSPEYAVQYADFALDTSKLKIASTVGQVLTFINNKFAMGWNPAALEAEMLAIEERYWADQTAEGSGKKRLLRDLEARDLVVSAVEIAAELERDYPQLLAALPEAMRSALPQIV